MRKTTLITLTLTLAAGLLAGLPAALVVVHYTPLR